MFGDYLYVALEEEEIRILVGKRKGRTLRVRGCGHIPVEREVWGQEWPQEGARRLKMLVQKQKWRGHKCFVLLDREGIVVRQARLPYLKPKELDKFLRSEMQEFLPVDVEDYVCDYAVVGNQTAEDGTKRQEILLAAVPRTVMNQLALFLEELGFPVEAVDIAPRCFLRLFEPNEGCMILNLKKKGGTVTLLDEAGLLLHADLPSYLGWEEDPEQLVAEARGYAEFFASRHQGLPVGEVWVCGGLVQEKPKVVENLQDVLPTSVRLAKAGDVGFTIREKRDTRFAEQSPAYAPLLGLALRR